VPDSRPVSLIAAVPRRDRYLISICLAAITALSWAYLVHLTRHPSSADEYARMMAEMGMAVDRPWTMVDAFFTFAMWTVMMVGMMLPSAAPAVLIFARVARSGPEPDRPVLRAYLFAAGYLVTWAAFSAVATALQSVLARAAWVTPMMETASPWLAAGILFVAGAYQWSAAKRNCLGRCRSPAAYITEHWRRGAWGALRLGAAHGAYCVGCCWALMGLLFAGGVMSLPWIAGLSLFVLFEKLGPASVWVDRVTGAALVLAGLALVSFQLGGG
jgi:predicted metal-binding membrane protein